MGKGLFYPKLAATNLRKNHSVYRPYLLAVVLLVAMYYCLHSVSTLVVESGMAGDGFMYAILQMSAGIIGFLSVLVLFYVNSFIIKRRKREFGLYSILGMEKRHICLVMIWEVLLVAAGGVLVGMLAGAVFCQLFLMLLQRIVGLPVLLEFRIPLSAVGATAGLFAAAFVLVLLYDVASVIRSRPIELLHSDKAGEREPKARWLAAVFGLVTLLGGYWLALTVERPSDAVAVFLPAVLLVIIGTYCLFLAGSIAVLKLLRKNKGFYYRPRNFIPVSTLLYRMKQNAAGLASICILSTCVLVTLSSTVSLFLGEEDILQRQYPRAVNVDCISETPDSLETLAEASRRHAADYGVTIENPSAYRSFSFPAIRGEGGVYTSVPYYGSDTDTVIVLPLEDYNACTGEQRTLAQDQALLYQDGGRWAGGAVFLDGWIYEVAGELSDMPDFVANDAIGTVSLLVVRDYDAMEAVCRRSNQVFAGEEGVSRELYANYSFDVSGPAELEGYYETMRDSLNETVDRLADVGIRDWNRSGFYEMYGSLLFVGIFFVALFLIAAVLIIYYKQITEGFDDHDRFHILQNVGMSDREIKKVISKQVLLVFYLPLAVAILHIAVAFPVLCKLLQAFQMYNTTLFFACTAGAAALFTVFYLLTYKLTARTYFKIVHA